MKKTIQEKIISLCVDLMGEGMTASEALRHAGQIEIFAKAMDNNLYSDKTIALHQELERRNIQVAA